MKLTHLSLFSGIGGLDLAAEWAGIQTVGQCEWADYPTSILEKHWPNIPRWKDIRTLTGESFYERTGRRTVDIISGGFPCQPFSIAGKRRGKEDDRYLWPEMVRVIKELRPTWVIGENVAGIVRMALSDILSELESCGYRTRAFLIPACAVGARHRRYRVAIVARSDNGGRIYGQDEVHTAEGRKKTQCKPKQCCEDVSNAKSKRQQWNWETRDEKCDTRRKKGESKRYSFISGTNNGLCEWKEEKIQPGRNTSYCCSTKRGWTTEPVLGGVADGFSGWMDGNPIINYWKKEPDIPRTASGISNRKERLKCLGNAVVPQQFFPIFKAIAEIENMDMSY